MTDRGTERALPDLGHLYDWVIVTSERHVDPWNGKVDRWEQCIKVTATELAPNGAEYVRDIAWFQPTDIGMDLARAFVALFDWSGDGATEVPA